MLLKELFIWAFWGQSVGLGCQVNVFIKKWKSWKIYHFIMCGSEIMTTWNVYLLAMILNETIRIFGVLKLLLFSHF